MSDFLRAAVAVLSVGALLHLLGSRKEAVTVVSPASASAASSLPAPAAPCPPEQLPADGVCIPVAPRVAGLAAERSARLGKTGAVEVYEHVPRAPGRPVDFRAYRLPVEPRPGQDLVSSGYDLDRPSEEQRRGPRHAKVGHGGLDLSAPRGTPVRLVRLEGQQGEAELLYAGELYGTTVVTLHVVQEGGRARDVIALHAHLDGTAPGLRPGAALREGDVLGHVGDSGTPGDVHLHFELRRLHEGVAPRAEDVGALLRADRSLVIDPRNLLPLR